MPPCQSADKLANWCCAGYVVGMSVSVPCPILIAGPTASGKSALAIAVARAVGGVVINADALQVYAELSILTARPSTADEVRVPHRLYGHVPASVAYSAGRYASDMATAIAAARTAGQRPVIVGGTGLYFKVLLEGLSPVPAIDPAVRAHWRAEAARLGAGGLYDILLAHDPEMAARLRPSDPQRLTRALEVLEGTGLSLAYWQRLPGVPVIEGPTVRLVLAPDAVALRARCDARVDAMIAAGALDEVRALAALSLATDLPVLGALGVAPLMAHIAGEIAQAAAVERTKLDTWHFVKRQKTWLRRNMSSWNIVQIDEINRNDGSMIDFIDCMPVSG